LPTDYNAAAAEVAAQAGRDGNYLAVVGDGASGIGGAGNYRISLALAPEKFAISPGDDGGPVPQSGGILGEITTGDVDVWSFEANAGDVVTIAMEEQGGTALTPWWRLYDAHGQLLRSQFHASLAQFQITVPQSGLYFIVATDGSAGLGGTGTYQLTVSGLPVQGKQLRYERPSVGSLLINWPSDLTGHVLQQSPELPASLWTDVEDPPFDNGFNVRITVPIPTTGDMFFKLRPPEEP
jgi:hypothetical protein